MDRHRVLQRQAVAKLAGGVAGMVGGGLLVRWLGRTRTIRAAALTTAAAGVAMGLAAAFWSSPLVTQAYLLLYVMAHTLATIAFFATAMALLLEARGSRPVRALHGHRATSGTSRARPSMGSLVGVTTDAQALFVMALVPVAVALVTLRVDVDGHVARVEAFSGRAAPASPAALGARAAVAA